MICRCTPSRQSSRAPICWENRIPKTNHTVCVTEIWMSVACNTRNIFICRDTGRWGWRERDCGPSSLGLGDAPSHLSHRGFLTSSTKFSYKEMTLCHFFLYSVKAGFGVGRVQGMPRKVPWGISLGYWAVPVILAGSQVAVHSSKQLLHQFGYNLGPFKLFFHSIGKPFLLAIICTKFIFER